jgi:hypothetical protein
MTKSLKINGSDIKMKFYQIKDLANIAFTINSNVANLHTHTHTHTPL